MIIGIPKEIKNNENRVSAIPANVYALVKQGNKVLVERGAGLGSGIADEEYAKAGAEIIADAAAVWAAADMIIKVKEPLHEEYKYFRENLLLFTYLHLAAEKSLTKALLESGVTGVAYETVQLAGGALPLLAPMSEVAGRMSVQIGAALLQKYNGGRGVLLGGVPGVLAGNVVVAGAGVVGLNAARIAAGMGANVTILDINKLRLQYVDEVFGGRIKTLYSNEYNLVEQLKTVDLFVSGVLIPGARAPKIVSEDMVKAMPAGAVIVDVAIDQGGSVATIDRVTTHDNPSFVKHGVIHYSVANMPGAVPRTSTFALSNATLPYALKLAKDGLAALDADPALKLGLNTYQGKITNKGVEEAYNA